MKGQHWPDIPLLTQAMELTRHDYMTRVGWHKNNRGEPTIASLLRTVERQLTVFGENGQRVAQEGRLFAAQQI